MERSLECCRTGSDRRTGSVGTCPGLSAGIALGEVCRLHRIAGGVQGRGLTEAAVRVAPGQWQRAGGLQLGRGHRLHGDGGRHSRGSCGGLCRHGLAAAADVKHNRALACVVLAAPRGMPD